MNHIFTEYERVEDCVAMTLTADYLHTCYYDERFHEKLKLQNWCYDTAKGEVYCFDSTMEVPALLGIKSPRVYLWKYVAFLHTGKVVKSWRGRKYADYRVAGNGTFVIEATV